MPWTRIDGTEQVILGDLSGLADNAPVEVETGQTAAKLAGAMPSLDHHPAKTATGSGTVEASK